MREKIFDYNHPLGSGKRRLEYEKPKTRCIQQFIAAYGSDVSLAVGVGKPLLETRYFLRRCERIVSVDEQNHVERCWEADDALPATDGQGLRPHYISNHLSLDRTD